MDYWTVGQHHQKHQNDKIRVSKTKIKNSPHFNDCVQRSQNMREDIFFNKKEENKAKEGDDVT